jgi:hypothetical protein
VPAASFNEGFYKVRAHLRVRGSSPPSDLIETSPFREWRALARTR